MKAIRLILIFNLLFIISCSKTNEDTKLFADNGNPFIRFYLLVNPNNEVIEFPEISGGITASSFYDKQDVKVLKIPVVLSAANLNEPVTASFETSITGTIDLDISPTETVSFNPNKLVDTIFVKANNRWDQNTIQELKLKLTSISNSDIAIGIQNTSESNDELTISFSEPILQYTFESNRLEITGETNEDIFFKVNFPLGYFENEIDESLIFSFLNGFDYTLSKLNQDDTSITYKISLNESINNDDVFYQTIINLEDTDNYTATGNKILQIVKPIKTDRNIAVNTASNFYNLSDIFYRLYGEMWNDFNQDNVCEWGFFFAFAKPVVVDASNPNAILFDDMGTADTSDDIYHHAFQVGFRSNRADLTTNSFNLKRYFNNETNSFAESPGFDVMPAIEFFPENGTSTTNGTMLIIPQFLTIAGRNGNSYNFGLSGAGTYMEISPGIFELKFELKLTNDEIFGGTLTSQYLMYNTRDYPEPADINAPCIIDYDL